MVPIGMLDPSMILECSEQWVDLNVTSMSALMQSECLMVIISHGETNARGG